MNCETMTDEQATRRASSLATYVAGALTAVCAAFFGYQYSVEYHNSQLEHFRAQLIVASSPNAIIMCSEDGTIVDSNLTAEQLFGWEHRMLVGQKATVLMPTDTAPLHTKKMSEAVKRIRDLPPQDNWMVVTAELHVRGIHRDGKTLVDLKASIRVIKLRDGSVQFIAYFSPIDRPPSEESIEQLPPDIMTPTL